ncbi:MAG: COX15/CtaA family protein, partial [Pseudomonadota bacterium]
RKIPPGWTGRLALLGVLGGLQGAIGWWMVSSGLEGSMLDVASYRLATHLGLAFIILGFIMWYMLMLKRDGRELMQARRTGEARLSRITSIWIALVFLQVLLGALVAGIDAGRSFTDWPLMSGQFIPPFFWMPELGFRNFFENAGLVQFIHRMAGYVLFAYSIFAWLQGRKSAYTKTQSAFTGVFILLTFQVVLGVVTVLYAAPWQIAIVHQLVAVAVFAAVLRARFLCQYPMAQSVRGEPA